MHIGVEEGAGANKKVGHPNFSIGGADTQAVQQLSPRRPTTPNLQETMEREDRGGQNKGT